MDNPRIVLDYESAKTSLLNTKNLLATYERNLFDYKPDFEKVAYKCEEANALLEKQAKEVEQYVVDPEKRKRELAEIEELRTGLRSMYMNLLTSYKEYLNRTVSQNESIKNMMQSIDVVISHLDDIISTK